MYCLLLEYKIFATRILATIIHCLLLTTMTRISTFQLMLQLGVHYAWNVICYLCTGVQNLGCKQWHSQVELVGWAQFNYSLF